MANKETGFDHRPYWDDEEEVLNPEAFAVHPGPFLKRNVMEGRDITVSSLAEHIKVARPGLNNMLNGKRTLTTELALKIEKATGYPAAVLCQMQTTYDLAHGREEVEVAYIAPIKLYA